MLHIRLDCGISSLILAKKMVGQKMKLLLVCMYLRFCSGKGYKSHEENHRKEQELGKCVSLI